MKKIAKAYPDLQLKTYKGGWEVIIPEKYKVGHEANFAEVTKKYLGYFKKGKLPEWEISDMLSKYYTTTRALEFALKN